MSSFLDENFLLGTETAAHLYHDVASFQPILDYHSHLDPAAIAEDRPFRSISDLWLQGDHYKWRAMRANGVDEHFCTGEASDLEKFTKWAETVPYTVRNPLFHWTHLELQRYFNISELLNPSSARKIYDICNEKLRGSEFSPRNLLKKMRVKILCTTDDPADTLEYHKKIKTERLDIRVLPTFRPDKALNVEKASHFNEYLQRLESIADISIGSFDQYLQALRARHDYFSNNGCTISDHGLESMYSDPYSEQEIYRIFSKIRIGSELESSEKMKIKSALLHEFSLWDYEKQWVQQFHLGAMRNNNSRMLSKLGPDTGWDSIGDFPQAIALAKFLDRLDSQNKLTRTILYNLNPADNEVMATMIGNFNDGSIPGKIQWGAAWWFLDQQDGMLKQINALSDMGLLSRFIGMLTDSRSFLSFPRHEYFRRTLCKLLGEEIEKGELPNDLGWIEKLLKDICYFNAESYFGWSAPVTQPL